VMAGLPANCYTLLYFFTLLLLLILLSRKTDTRFTAQSVMDG